MKIFYAFAIFVFSLSSVNAQTVLHLDITKVLKEMPETASADAMLQERANMYKLQEDSLITEFKSSQEMLQKGLSEGTVTQKEVNAKEASLVELEKLIQKTRNANRANLEKYRQELAAPAMKKIYAWIGEIAEKRNASIIYDLYSGNIMYINEKLSINDEMLNKIKSTAK